MSGALVPSSNAPSGFTQQGSLDWVALSNTSVNFSVAVLSRLSKAGIDALTLHVGRAICFNFALEPQSQERVSDEIRELKRYGSYGDLVWFGFGIKGVVSDLAGTEEGLLQRKASILPSGRSLVHTDIAPQGASILNWHSSWSTILRDVFHSSIDILMTGKTGLQFSLYLSCVACLPICNRNDKSGRYSELDRSFRDHPVVGLSWVCLNNIGINFLEYAVKRLPELSQCLSEFAPAVHAGTPLNATLELGNASLQSIGNTCCCSSHNNTHYRQPERGNFTNVCLLKISQTIVMFLFVLINCEIDDDVCPSVTGLTNLFIRPSCSRASGQGTYSQFIDSILPDQYPAFGIDLIYLVLSGSSAFSQYPNANTRSPEWSDTTEDLITDTLARVGNGICVFYSAVENPTLPIELLFKLRIVRGYIHHAGCHYKELSGWRVDFLTDSTYATGIPGGLHKFTGDIIELVKLHGDLTERSLQAVVQDSGNATCLEIAYKFCYPERSNQHTVLWLHLPALFRKLRFIMRNPVCPGYCNALYEQGDSLARYHNHATRQTFGVTGTYDEKSYDQAQELLRNMRQSCDSWILVNEPATYSIINGRPLLLYALVTQYGGCLLIPFTSCLKCIIIQGIESHILGPGCSEHGPDGDRSFTTTLITSEEVNSNY